MTYLILWSLLGLLGTGLDIYERYQTGRDTDLGLLLLSPFLGVVIGPVFLVVVLFSIYPPTIFDKVVIKGKR